MKQASIYIIHILMLILYTLQFFFLNVNDMIHNAFSLFSYIWNVVSNKQQ